MEYWEKLFIEWTKHNAGLTIPYLIGSQKLFDENYIPNPNNDINNMLDNILNNPQSFTFCINHCPTISEPILAIKKEEMEGDFPFDKGNTQNKLFICESIYSNGCIKRYSSIDQIRIWLIEEYSQLIQKDTCSKRNKEWSDYSNAESMFIRNVFKII